MRVLAGVALGVWWLASIFIPFLGFLWMQILPPADFVEFVLALDAGQTILAIIIMVSLWWLGMRKDQQKKVCNDCPRRDV